MARASWIQRLAAACAALAMACALLSPPPSLAAPEQPSDSPSHEIGNGASRLVGVVQGTTKRGAESTLVSLRVLASPGAPQPSAAGQRAAPRGCEAPALARWRLAHGTSTSSP